VIAQECSDLIKNRTPFQIRNISMAEPREMPGLENKKQGGSKIFTAESQIYAFGSPWGNAGNRMMQDSNYLQYGKEYPQSNSDWALEVFSQYIWIMKMKELSFNVILKLVETNSGKKIALDYSYDNFAIFLGKDISNFKSFEDEFRNAANILCSKTLRKMGLIY
jgi:hypothetical protein